MEEPKGPTVVDVAITGGRYRCYGTYRNSRGRRSFVVDLAEALDPADPNQNTRAIYTELRNALEKALGVGARMSTHVIDRGQHGELHEP